MYWSVPPCSQYMHVILCLWLSIELIDDVFLECYMGYKVLQHIVSTKRYTLLFILIKQALRQTRKLR